MTTQCQTILIKTRRGLLQVPGSARTGSTDLKHRCAGAASLANPSGFCPHPPNVGQPSYIITTITIVIKCVLTIVIIIIIIIVHQAGTE